jgi:Golgi phosphoprotein 3 (GPP34)
MLIAEEFLLLSLDDVSGKKTVSMETLEPALGGALLAELALLERIGVSPRSAGWRERGRVTVTSTVRPTIPSSIGSWPRSPRGRARRSRT